VAWRQAWPATAHLQTLGIFNGASHENRRWQRHLSGVKQAVIGGTASSIGKIRRYQALVWRGNDATNRRLVGAARNKIKATLGFTLSV